MNVNEGTNFDIAVIGAGPGGYVAAIRSAQLGAKVALIERSDLGGTCLNNGCIPSKAILASAGLLHQIRNAGQLNVTVNGNVDFDWRGIQQRKDRVLKTLRSGIERLIKANRISLFNGQAKLNGVGRIVIDDQNVSAKKIIIAVGSSPMELRGFSVDGEYISTSEQALHWPELPKSLLIIGGGVIGCEFACMMREFGVEVTVVEMLEELLPNLDLELGLALRKIFNKRKIRCVVGTKVEDVSISKDQQVEVKLSDGQTVNVEKVLIAVGRRANVEGLNLDSVGIRISEKGFIEVNEKLETNVEGYYCIGDANGRALLAHEASAQGCISVENALGGNKSYESEVPSAIYTFPEIASIGMSQEQAEREDLPIKVGKFPIGYLGKAIAVNQTEGFVKIIRNYQTDEILGIHMIGHNATEFLSSASVAMHTRMSVSELAETVFAHPTMSEAIKESAEAAISLAIHLPPARIASITADL